MNRFLFALGNVSPFAALDEKNTNVPLAAFIGGGKTWQGRKNYQNEVINVMKERHFHDQPVVNYAPNQN